MDGATSPSGERHPGKIVFEDAIEGTKTTEAASSVPRESAWVRDEQGEWQPVVRVRLTGAGSFREITKYGAGDKFLEVTSSAPPPSAAEAQQTPLPTPSADD